MGFVNEERTGANYYVKLTPKKTWNPKVNGSQWDILLMISEKKDMIHPIQII